MKCNNFFDENISFYGNVRLYGFDYHFIDFIRNNRKNTILKFLDLGGGSGTFAKLVATEIPDIEVSVLDPSKEMLNKIDDDSIKKIIGMLPNQIDFNSSFDFIHTKEVFHHITDSSIEGTRDLLKKSLFNIKKILNKDGFLLIHELFYESPIFPTLSSAFIFYLLKIQNKSGIKFPIDEFRNGLEVYFYTREEFKIILNDCGYEIIDYYEENWSNTLKKRLIFLKNWGRMVFVCKKVG